jgi:hypothetical protein
MYVGIKIGNIMGRTTTGLDTSDLNEENMFDASDSNRVLCIFYPLDCS